MFVEVRVQKIGAFMIDSILDTVKQACGIELDETAFDEELLLYINSIFVILHQIGVGPDTTFIVEDQSSVWSDFAIDENLVSMLRSYVSIKVRLLFDPPTSSSLETALKETANEYEWRLNLESDKYRVGE